MLIELPGEYSLRAPRPLAGEHHHDGHDGADSRTVYGFWLYMMTDCVVFAAVFATFAVQSGSFAGGPTGKDVFDLGYVAVETALLLLSSVTYGFAMLALARWDQQAVMKWLAVTFLFGAAFIGMEIYEFNHLIAEGAGPGRSGFLSAFFTLVGTHGLHVTLGLVWMGTMMAQIAGRGLGGTTPRRLECLSLFWHFLDIVWICVFTVVYLMGVL